MPEPILISIAAALAGRGVTSLYEVVRKKFANRPAAIAALEGASDKAADSPEVGVLAEHLADASSDDPRFREQLVATWNAAQVDQSATGGAVNNQVSGEVAGNVLQTRDINGNVSFG